MGCFFRKPVQRLKFNFKYCEATAYCSGFFVNLQILKTNQNNELPSTADIRVSNFTYRISMNTGIEISFIKFYFAEDAVYMYIRNFSKNYQGPYKLSNINHDSDALQVQNFIKRNTNEAELGVESATGNTKYNFVLRGFSEKDFGLMKDGFSKIGFQS